MLFFLHCFISLYLLLPEDLSFISSGKIANSSHFVPINKLLHFPIFFLSSSAIIGSPNVSLFSNGATIEVSIEDPVLAISALRNVYIFATYNITYWKDSQKEKVDTLVSISEYLIQLWILCGILGRAKHY